MTTATRDYDSLAASLAAHEGKTFSGLSGDERDHYRELANIAASTFGVDSEDSDDSDDYKRGYSDGIRDAASAVEALS